MFRSKFLLLPIALYAGVCTGAVQAQQMPAWESPAAYAYFSRHRDGAIEERRLSSDDDARALDRYLSSINDYLKARDAGSPAARDAYSRLLATANALLAMPARAYPDGGGAPRTISFGFTPDGSLAVLRTGAWSAAMNGPRLRGFFDNSARALNVAGAGAGRGSVELGSFPCADQSGTTVASMRFEGQTHLPWIHLHGGGSGDLHLTTLNTFRLTRQMAAAVEAAAARHTTANQATAAPPQMTAARPSTTETVIGILLVLSGAAQRYQAAHQAWEARFAQPIYQSTHVQQPAYHPYAYGFTDGHGHYLRSNGAQANQLGTQLYSNDGTTYNYAGGNQYTNH